MAPSNHASSSSLSPSSSSSSSSSVGADNVTISHAPIEGHLPQRQRRGAEQGGSSVGFFEASSSSSHTDDARDEARQAIVSSLVQILEQPLGMLRDGTIGDAQMAAESRLIPGSSLGKHLRHVHDHYRVLLDSLEAHAKQPAAAAQPLSLDYDKRMSIPPLETNTRAAVHEFEAAQRRIHELLGEHSSAWETDLDRHVTLSATTPTQVELGSTLGREMWFVCLHAIHHYALARVILVHELGCKIDDQFGVAPSTLVLRAWRRATSSSKSPEEGVQRPLQSKL